MATFYLDYEGGSDAADGTTFANRWKTITSGATAARIAPGDTIRIMGSPAPTSLGINGTWTDLSKTVTLASALTSNIDMGETAWTASANVTATKSTSDYKENTGSSSIAIAAGFTTGKAAYIASANTNYSGYKQVSFWIKQTSGTVVVAGDVSIRLCSDALGATPVNTINIPALVALNRWIPITIDTGSALGASIGSVAFYVDTDRGAQTFLIDNIIACKDSTSADSLTLTSLIGKNTTNENWHAIQSINGTTVLIDNGTNTLGNAGRGYSGTTETVTTYKRETIKTAMVSAAGTVVAAIQDSGTSGNLITFSGGWDRTNMSTQTLQTWFDGQNGFGIGINTNSMNYVRLEKIGCIRYGSAGIQMTSLNNSELENIYCNNSNTVGLLDSGTNTKNTLNNIYCTGNTTNGISCTALQNSIISNIYILGNLSVGIQASSSVYANQWSTVVTRNNAGNGMTLAGNNFINTITASNNTSSGFQAGTAGIIIKNGTFQNNSANGVNFVSVGNCSLYNCTTSGNTTSGISSSSGINYLYNCTISDTTEVAAPTAYSGSRIISIKNDATANNHLITLDGGTISSDASVRHTASGISWKFSPTSSNRNSNYPLNMVIATVACNASSLVTVKCWFYRSHANLVGTLKCGGGQIGGVSADVTSSMTVGAATWEELTITFTPNEIGVVEIEALFYPNDGVTTYSGYVDDMTISQA